MHTFELLTRRPWTQLMLCSKTTQWQCSVVSHHCSGWLPSTQTRFELFRSSIRSSQLMALPPRWISRLSMLPQLQRKESVAYCRWIVRTNIYCMLGARVWTRCEHQCIDLQKQSSRPVYGWQHSYQWARSTGGCWPSQCMGIDSSWQ